MRALRARDPRWGFNWVRGMVGDSNGDVVGYSYGPGAPTENSRFVTIVDIVGGRERHSRSEHERVLCTDRRRSVDVDPAAVTKGVHLG